jgi:hypothetical protein
MLRTIINLARVALLLTFGGAVIKRVFDAEKKEKDFQKRRTMVYDVIKCIEPNEYGDKMIKIFDPNDSEGNTYDGTYTELVIKNHEGDGIVYEIEKEIKKAYSEERTEKLLYSEVKKLYTSTGSDGETTWVTVEI